MSHSSTSTGEPPSEVTASTIVSASCLCAISTSVFASDSTPVEVSACTNATSLRIRVLLQRVFELLRIDRLAPFVLDDDRRCRRSARRSRSCGRRTRRCGTRSPCRPGATRLTKQYSMPTEPGPGDRERERVLGLVGVAQQRLQLFHHLDEDRDRGSRSPAGSSSSARADGFRSDPGPSACAAADGKS